MSSKQFDTSHALLLAGMCVLFIGHVFLIGSPSAFLLGLPWWYWTVTAVSLLLYAGVVVLVRDLAVTEYTEQGMVDR